MKTEIASAITVLALLIGAGIGYYGEGRATPPPTLTVTSTSTVTTNGQARNLTQTVTSSLLQTITSTLISTSTTVSTASASTTTAYYCGSNTSVMRVNGSTYCMTDISSDINIQNPGYSYFLNGSVYFMGVKFRTICPPIYSGCPGSSNGNHTVITVSASAIGFNMTFPDQKVETSGNVIGDSNYVLMLSNHVNPRAGMIIQYVGSAFKVFLLASYFGG